MEYEGLILEKRENIAILTLNRPERLNALTERMITVLFPEIFRELQEDNEVRVLIITGAGKGFCSGADVAELGSVDDTRKLEEVQESVQLPSGFPQLLYNLHKPVIAAVNGVAAGAGLSIALLSDLRIASENARFSFAFVRRGLIPDCGCTFLMPRLMGAAKSFELMYTGDIVDAKEAERIGLVNKVVPQHSLMDEVNSLAKRLAEGPPLALAQIKRAIHTALISDLQQQLFFETCAQILCFWTEDFKEGVNAFLDKRKPQFKGQ